MADMAGKNGDEGVRFREPTEEEIWNTAAQLVYSAVSWKAAMRSRILLIPKGAAFGIKLMTPNWEAFTSDRPEDAEVVRVLNEFQQAFIGADPEDLIPKGFTKVLKARATRYFFGSDKGGVGVTTSFYSDP